MKLTTEERDARLAKRRARYNAGFAGYPAVAAELVAYGQGATAGQLVELAKSLWPVAYKHFDDIRHGRAVDNFHLLEVQAVYKLAREAAERGDVPTAERPSVKREKLKGMGWGHYPMIKNWEGQPLGSKITYSANKKNDKGRVRRTIIPTCSAHNAIIRKCNQILVEAEEQRLYLLETNTQDAKKIKERWKKRPSVRYFAIPQALNRVFVIHSEQKEGGSDVGAMCDGYGKAELYALVKGRVDNQPNGARAGMSNGWGKHYQFAQKVSKEGRAKIAQNARLTLNSRETSKANARLLKSTVGEDGRGLDYIEQATPEVEKLIEAGSVSPLTEKQLGSLVAIDSDFSLPSAITVKENAIVLSREKQPVEQAIQELFATADASTLSAKPPKQRNKPLGEAVGDRLQAMWEQIAAEQVREVQPC